MIVVVMGAIVAAAGLLLWQLSPASSLLGHDARPGAPSGAARVGWFTVSWLLMTAATMLPTSLPLLSAFARLLGDRRDAGRLIATVVAAYLALWTVAGLALATIDAVVHILAERTALARHTWLVLPLTLVVAGGYQLSGTSARCLRACRLPFSFLARRWSGRRAAATEATLIGFDYGASCLGCCAALMLVMFAVGMSSPLLMIELGGVAALYKRARWGATLARATGIVLLLAAAVMGVGHVTGVAHVAGTH
jgi:predicted metal-binding membrane protein